MGNCLPTAQNRVCFHGLISNMQVNVGALIVCLHTLCAEVAANDDLYFFH